MRNSAACVISKFFNLRLLQVDLFHNTARPFCSKIEAAMNLEKFQIAKRLTGTESSIWIEFGALAKEHDALNLGQGFPDFLPPSYITDSLMKVSENKNDPFLHQYTRSFGHPRLVNVMAETYSKIFNRKIDALNEILISVGAYSSLYYTHQGLINPGDEVIIIEPFFDCYKPMVLQTGGIPCYISLKSTKAPGTTTTTADWTFDREELKNAFNDKTKAIIINNPNNPLGKVFTREELEFVADLCKKHDVIAVSDEVYERLVYPSVEFVRMANIPGMWERTITIGSAGKTFSVTGWKLGWSIGPSYLLKALRTVHQNCSYTCATPLQEAVALNFEKELELYGTSESYFHQLPIELVEKRDKLINMFTEIGMLPVVPEAGYFVVVDVSPLSFQADPNNKESKDYQFVKWMTKNKKLSAIPNSAFYSDEHAKLAENLVRFCFIKQNSTLEKAAAIFHEWKKSIE